MEARWTIQGWYYVRDGHQAGPFSTSQMRELSTRVPFTAADDFFLGWQSGDQFKLVPTPAKVFLLKTRSKSSRSGRLIKGQG